MAFRIAVCDDSAADITYVTGLLSRWAEATGHVVQTESFSSAEAFLFHYEKDKTYDILLLDVEMGELNGVELAKQIRRENQGVQLVFITGYSDYIAEGYEVAALHYLMKPVDEQKFFTVMNRAAEKVKKNERSILLDASGEMVRIPLYEIRYLEVCQNYVTVHGAEDYTVRKTLGELEQHLDENFFRTGRSFIVNLAYVRRVTRTEVVLSGDIRVPLSRGQYEPINRAIISRC